MAGVPVGCREAASALTCPRTCLLPPGSWPPAPPRAPSSRRCFRSSNPLVSLPAAISGGGGRRTGASDGGAGAPPSPRRAARRCPPPLGPTLSRPPTARARRIRVAAALGDHHGGARVLDSPPPVAAVERGLERGGARRELVPLGLEERRRHLAPVVDDQNGELARAARTRRDTAALKFRATRGDRVTPPNLSSAPRAERPQRWSLSFAVTGGGPRRDARHPSSTHTPGVVPATQRRGGGGRRC